MTGTDYYPEKPVISPIRRFDHIVGGCAGTQYGCNEDRSSRTKEEWEQAIKLGKIVLSDSYREHLGIELKPESIRARILPVELPNVIVIPEIIKPLLEKDNFEEILEAESGGIKIGKVAMLKTIITGVIVGIILMKVIK